jgi:coenzyme PQQ precursor peptide PqqA
MPGRASNPEVSPLDRARDRSRPACHYPADKSLQSLQGRRITAIHVQRLAIGRDRLLALAGTVIRTNKRIRANRNRRLGVDRVPPQGGYWRLRMAWETPVVEEIAVGLEVTAYVSAEEDELL